MQLMFLHVLYLLKFENQISFARKMVKELRDEKCDIIICVSHSGVAKGQKW